MVLRTIFIMFRCDMNNAILALLSLDFEYRSDKNYYVEK